MEQINLIGAEIMNLVKTNNTITFGVDALGVILNFQITGIKSIKRNNEYITELTQIDSYVSDIYTDTEEYPINELIITFENGDTYKMMGEMDFSVLNMDDFKEIIEMYENEHVCGCGGNCEKQTCGCK